MAGIVIIGKSVSSPSATMASKSNWSMSRQSSASVLNMVHAGRCHLLVVDVIAGEGHDSKEADGINDNGGSSLLMGVERWGLKVCRLIGVD